MLCAVNAENGLIFFCGLEGHSLVAILADPLCGIFFCPTKCHTSSCPRPPAFFFHGDQHPFEQAHEVHHVQRRPRHLREQYLPGEPGGARDAAAREHLDHPQRDRPVQVHAGPVRPLSEGHHQRRHHEPAGVP